MSCESEGGTIDDPKPALISELYTAMRLGYHSGVKRKPQVMYEGLSLPYCTLYREEVMGRGRHGPSLYVSYYKEAHIKKEEEIFWTL